MSKRKRAHVEPTTTAPLLATHPLPAPLLAAWRSELASADSQDERAHWWAQPHWIELPSTVSGSHEHGLIGATLRHVLTQFGTDDKLQLTEAVGCEFWTQRRAIDSSLHLHWDVDEELGRLQHELACPLASVILYLGDIGGPTLILDQAPDQAQPAQPQPGRAQSGGWLLWPHPGQIAAFRGNLLHAVLGLPPQAPEQTNQGCRMTVIFNYWGKRPVDLPPLPAVLIPPLPQIETDQEVELPVHRTKTWSALEVARWPIKTLLLGQFDRSEQVELRLPEVVYRGYHMEAFDAASDQNE